MKDDDSTMEVTDHVPFDSHGERVQPPPSMDDAVQCCRESQNPADPRPPIEDVIADIAITYRRWLAFHKAHQRLDLHIKAIGRVHEVDPQILFSDDPTLFVCEHNLKTARERAARQLEKLVLQLPIAHWVEKMRGIGAKSVGQFIGAVSTGQNEKGEIRTLSDFPNPAKVWKFFGLHVEEDGRAPRRKTGQTLGYKPVNRAIVHNMVGPAVQKQGAYRALYEQAKAEYVSRGWDAEKNGALRTNRAEAAARRKVGKKIVKHIWIEWHRVCKPK